MTRTIRGLLLLALASALGPSLAQAETYRVDVIIFLQGGGEENAVPARTPPPMRTIGLGDSAALSNAGIRLLPDGTGALQTAWQRITNSHRYQILQRLSWVQIDPPETHGPALKVEADGLDGSIALLAGHYLHLDVDLSYTRGDSTWRLDQTRRMRRDEVHYLDSPRIGVLAEVGKAE